MADKVSSTFLGNARKNLSGSKCVSTTRPVDVPAMMAALAAVPVINGHCAPPLHPAMLELQCSQTALTMGIIERKRSVILWSAGSPPPERQRSARVVHSLILAAIALGEGVRTWCPARRRARLGDARALLDSGRPRISAELTGGHPVSDCGS